MKSRTSLKHFDCPNRDLNIGKQTQSKFFSRSKPRTNSFANFKEFVQDHNPISQSSEFFQTKPWKSSSKRNALWNTSTGLTKPSFDEKIHNRSIGTFNDRQRPVKDDLNWRSCVHPTDYYHAKPKIDMHADVKRGTRRVDDAYLNRDPILQTGDKIEKTKSISKIRDEVKPSELYSKMMERKRRNYEHEPSKHVEKQNYEKKNAGIERTFFDSAHNKLAQPCASIKDKQQGNNIGSL